MAFQITMMSIYSQHSSKSQIKLTEIDSSCPLNLSIMNSYHQYQIFQYEQQQIRRKVFRIKSHQSNQQSQTQLSQLQNLNLKDISWPISISGGTFNFQNLILNFNGHPPSNEQNVRSIAAKPNFQMKRQNKPKVVSLNARRHLKQIPWQIRQDPQKPNKSLNARKYVQNFQSRDQEDKQGLFQEKSKKKCFPSRKGPQEKIMKQLDISKKEIRLGSSQKFLWPISSVKKRSTNRVNQSVRNQSYQMQEVFEEEEKRNEKDGKSSSISISSNQNAKISSRYE